MHTPRTLLERARLNGYLNAACEPQRAELLRSHGFWCWKLRIPLVCYQRNSARSRLGSVHLDLFTTPHALTDQAQAELARLSRHATITPYDGVWTNVPSADLETVARAAYRIATRRGNYALRPAAHSPELAKLIAAIHAPADPLRRIA
jgi:hypothetical protein